MYLILIILLILCLVGGLPSMPYMANSNLGYYPSGVVGLILVVILIVFLLGGRL